MALLQSINQQLGVTILMITHEMEVVKSVCHRVALLEHGKLVEVADVDSFFGNPQSDLGKRFVAQSQHFELPEHIASQLVSKDEGDYPVVKLAFYGGTEEKPVISHLAREFHLDINILQAKIEHIRTTNIGLMIAELMGEPEQMQQALDYLHTLPLSVEVLGYGNLG